MNHCSSSAGGTGNVICPQKVLDASRRALAEAPWHGTEHTNTFQVDMFVVSEKTVL